MSLATTRSSANQVKKRSPETSASLPRKTRAKNSSPSKPIEKENQWAEKVLIDLTCSPKVEKPLRSRNALPQSPVALAKRPRPSKIVLDSPPASQAVETDGPLNNPPVTVEDIVQPPLTLDPSSPEFPHQFRASDATLHQDQLPAPLVASASPEPRSLPQSKPAAEELLNVEPAAPKMVSYYIRNFISVVKHAYPRYQHLFTAEERNYVEKFQVLPVATQRLFVRLYQRSGTWFKLNALDYGEIDDIGTAAQCLASADPPYAQFLKSEADFHSNDALIRELCASVLKADELRSALRDSHHTPAPGRGGLSTMKVDDLLSEVADALRKGQKNLLGRRVFPGVLWRMIGASRLLRLAPDPVAIFMRIDSLFFLAPRSRKAQNQFLLDEMGVIRFPSYEISEQFSRVFRSREELLAWECMNQVDAQFESAVTLGDVDAALRVVRMAVSWLVQCADTLSDPLLVSADEQSTPQAKATRPNPRKIDHGIIRIDSDSEESKPTAVALPAVSPARVDSSGWECADLRLQWEMALADLPATAVMEMPAPLSTVQLEPAAARALVAERPFLSKFHVGSALALIATAGSELLEKRRQYETANMVLRILLACPFSPSKRGRWWDRLTLNLEQHMKQKSKALVLAAAGLADEHVRSGRRQNLQKRVLRLHAPPLRWGPKPQFPNASLRSPTEITISRTLLTRVTGKKSAFIGLDGNMRTVEEVALEHYATTEGWSGRHTENGTFATLFGLLMWKCIYAPVPDVFHHPFQTAPLDWATDSFYESRAELIEAHLASLEKSSLAFLLDEAFEHEGERWPGVNWELYSLGELKLLVRCIDQSALCKVMRLLAKDYRHMMGGLPDLLLWRLEDRQAKLVEVKGPRDTLMPKQIVWIDQLLACGMQVEVCHVAETV